MKTEFQEEVNMGKIEYKPTNHSYYCNENNYYSVEAREEYSTWREFLANYNDCDLDYNMLFRFDISYSRQYWEKYEDMEIDSSLLVDGDLSLELFMMQQRRGKFIPIIVSEIRKCDIPEIEEYLEKNYVYLKELWSEFE